VSDRLVVDGFGRSLVTVIGTMIIMSGMGVLVRVSGFSRSVVVMGGMIVGTVVRGLDRCVGRFIRSRFSRMRVISRRRGRVMMVGVMRIVRVGRSVRVVCVVGLVFVAHVTPVPQPLCTVFDRETGIT
tara:strand:- start:66308 stop:66691 length:384 start_codon:yes stop_codon:yes gene_type:complete